MAPHTTSDLKGIHYAPPRNTLLPGVWEDDLTQTWDCQLPGCELVWDSRMSAIHLRYKWAHLNPSQDTYDFSDLDGVISEMAAAGKKVTIGVMAGKYTPDYVFDLGCIEVPLDYTVFNPEHETTKVPIPHDPVYRDAYNTMMKELGSHITGNATRNNTVVLVKSGLVTTASVENRLLLDKAYDDASMPSYSTTDEKRQLIARRFCYQGYQGQLAIETIEESCDVIKTAFPDQFVGIPFVRGGKRFPTNGTKVFPGTLGDNTTLKDAMLAVATTHGNRAVFNDTTWTADTGVLDLYADITAAGGLVACQINAQELGYRNSDRPNDPTGLTAAIQKAYDEGLLFVEVHDGNMEEHKSELISGDTLLRS